MLGVSLGSIEHSFLKGRQHPNFIRYVDDIRYQPFWTLQLRHLLDVMAREFICPDTMHKCFIRIRCQKIIDAKKNFRRVSGVAILRKEIAQRVWSTLHVK